MSIYKSKKIDISRVRNKVKKTDVVYHYDLYQNDSKNSARILR